jgi:hypothetical protein
MMINVRPTMWGGGGTLISGYFKIMDRVKKINSYSIKQVTNISRPLLTTAVHCWKYANCM